MPIDPAQAAAEAASLNQQRGESSKLNYFKFEEGPNIIRILPPFGNKTEAWKKYKNCFNVGPNRKQIIVAFDDNCFFKKHLDILYSSDNADAKAAADSMYPRNRVGLFVVARSPHKQADEGLLFWETNINVYKDILTIIADPEYGDITDPVRGLDLSINYTPKEKTANHFPDWKVTPRRNSSPLAADPAKLQALIGTDWFEHYNIGRPADAEYIRACLEGREAEFIEAKKAAGSSGQTSTPPKANLPPPSGDTVNFPGALQDAWWVLVNGAGAQTTADEICEAVLQGQNPTVCSADGKTGWIGADKAGFVLVKQVQVPIAPPIQPPVAAPPAPHIPNAPSPPPMPTPIPNAPSPPPQPIPIPTAPVAEEKYWIMLGQTPELMTRSLVIGKMQAGYTGMLCVEGGNVWTPAQQLIQVLPSPPAIPPQAPQLAPSPTLPIPASVHSFPGMSPADLALQQQIEQLRNGMGQNSQVVQDLRK